MESQYRKNQKFIKKLIAENKIKKDAVKLNSKGEVLQNFINKYLASQKANKSVYRENQKLLKKFRKDKVVRKDIVKLNAKKAVLQKQVDTIKRKNRIVASEERFNQSRTQPPPITYDSQELAVINGFSAFRIKVKSKIDTLEQMHNAVLKATNDLNLDVAYVILHFIDTSDTRRRGNRSVIHLTVSPADTEEEEDFVARVKEMMELGGDAGSDKYNGLKHMLVKNVFDLYITTAIGEGSSDLIIYDCEGLDNEKGECAYDCIKKIYGIDCGREEKLELLYNMIRKVKELNSKSDNVICEIVSNSFTINTDFKEIMKRKAKVVYVNKKKHRVRKIETGDIGSVYVFKEGEYNEEGLLLNPEIYEGKERKYIIYDKLGKHYDVLKSFNINDNIYISNNRDVIVELKGKGKTFYRTIYKAKQRDKINNAKYGKKIKYIFFDYETVINWNNVSCMETYSLSFFVADDEILARLNTADENGDTETVERLMRTNCHNSIGFDCSNALLDYIIDNQHQTLFTLISFNGSNFDNFLLLDFLLRTKHTEKCKFMLDENKIFYNGTQLLNFCINWHGTFDVCKHLSGKLTDLCDDFKIKTCAKLHFDHSEAQTLFDNGTLIEEIKKNKELIKYNNFDVLSLGVLYWRYKQALTNMEITEEYGKNLHNNLTIGGIIWKVAGEWWDKKGYKFGNLPLDLYKDILKYKVAGRVEMFNGVAEILEAMMSMDACSLYPYVLSILDVYYPYGEITLTDEYVKGKIGFYYCDIDQRNLKQNNLPNILPEKTKNENLWDSDATLNDYCISSVMIEQFQKYGCDIKIKNGFYFEDKAKSCEMFGFLHELMGAKNEQDKHKQKVKDIKKKLKEATKDEDIEKLKEEYIKADNNYNASLRATLKLLMNAISGKIIEGLHVKKTSVCDAEKFLKIANDKRTKKINTINIIGENVFVSHEVNEEYEIEKQRPVYLGVLCYDYAKCFMFDHVYAPIGLKNLVYTDTDAGKAREIHIKKWIDDYASKKIVPHWEEVELIDDRYKTHKLYEKDSKVFGSFENELKQNNYFVCVQKKAWFSCNTIDEVDNNVKLGFKGVAQSSLVITKEEAQEIDKMSNQERYNYYQNNKSKRMVYEEEIDGEIIQRSNAKTLFKGLIEHNEGYVLTQSFNKVIKNQKKGVGIDEVERFNTNNNKIMVRYNIKRIVIPDKNKLVIKD